MSEDRGMNRMTSERFRHLGENWTKTGMEEGFPGGSDSKESACNARDLGLISGLGRSPGEGNSNQKTPFSCLEYAMDKGAWRAAVHGVAKSQI